jgi:protein-arginine kinase activator protein McsA
MFQVEVTPVVSLAETTVKKIYVCQNVAKKVSKTGIKQIAKQKSINQILKQTPVKFNQTITLSHVASKETIFCPKMITFTPKNSLARKTKQAVKTFQSLKLKLVDLLLKLKIILKEELKRTAILAP